MPTEHELQVAPKAQKQAKKDSTTTCSDCESVRAHQTECCVSRQERRRGSGVIIAISSIDVVMTSAGLLSFSSLSLSELFTLSLSYSL